MKKKIENLFNYLREFVKKHEQFCFLTFAIVSVIAVIYFPLNELINTLKENEERMYSYYVYQDRNMLLYYNAKEELVEEVEKYINSVAPNSAINAITLVNKCDEYNIDIIFVLAQAQKESHFGTMGMAAKTNSVFNVFAFDNYTEEDMRTLGKTYKHPDHSIEPYLKLLTSKYFVNGKTEKDMFDQFVDINGLRYASYEGYERDMRLLYNKIDSTTNLTEKIENFNKFKLIVGK